MKRLFSLCVAVLMIFSLLAACSSKEEKTASTPKDQDKQEGKTTIQFWHSLGGVNGEYMDALIKRFNDSQDKVEVVGTFQGTYDETSTKLQQALSANTAPDVAMIERAYVQMFAESDVLEDLKPYFKKSGLSEDDFAKGLMGHSTFNKKLVSLPLNRSTPILHVNKTMLDEAGLKVPTTWDELKEVSNALVQKEGNEIKRYGLTMPYDTWYPIAMISQSGGKFFNKDNTSDGFNKNGIGKEVFGYLKDLQKSGALYYPPAQDSGNIVNQMFSSGKVAMMFQSTGTIGGIAQNSDFEYVTAFLPKNDEYATPTGGGNVSMIANSKNKEAAWEFIHFMMDDPQGLQQFILESGYLPFTKKMAESKEIQELWAKEPNRKTAYEQLKYATDTNKNTAWPEIMHEFFSAIEAIMYDDADIQKSLDTFTKETERILAQ
ncbi:ABC transporter substrate-binding protein [Neobacillus sp. MM2021_6]|uniref:ABC transporter substrate-binding protein n=1 Tax=Bacillaceae TaxID=186817 RepID=UPI00140AA867|nr:MULTISPECIES: ABC transporter substrate-binding protein [Bacillaceae]MBO0958805.1 ABC transporter substrate-binding protein [Neobacillus sp. MM2021_6]NHC20030.1 ABC transporter substrate-binding protein [Bacillus sp. MM2020_4]WML41412.1 ABC transporter substrate-binding protein [Neobacillus sp. OS1-2]